MASKKNYLIFLFMVFYSITVSGQESPKNVISYGINLSELFPAYVKDFTVYPGLSVEYERILNDFFSIGLGIGTNITTMPYGEILGHWYPWAKTFYAGLGVGIIRMWGYYPAVKNPTDPTVLSVSPEVGWKVDIGKKNKWVIIPSVTTRMAFLHIYPDIMLDLCIKIGNKF